MKNQLSEAFFGANVTSIEYVGHIILKLAISRDSILYAKFREIIIEFVSGIELVRIGGGGSSGLEGVFELLGVNITDVQLSSQGNQLLVVFDSGHQLKSISSQDPLVDRNWVVRPPSCDDSYVLNDAGTLFSSEDMRPFIDS